MIKVFNIKLDSYSFTGMAVIVGYLLTNEFDVLEQAALGAWFNVVGDILASNSSCSSLNSNLCAILITSSIILYTDMNSILTFKNN